MKMDCLFPNARRTGKILVLGELLMDFVPADISMRLSDPGMVVKTVSGSAGIYACAAAAFGADVGFIGKVGPDPFSRLALSTVGRLGVGTENVVQAAEGKLGLAFVEYGEGRRSYVYYRDNSVGSRFGPGELREEAFVDARILHLPGMLLELNENMRAACFRAVELAKKHRVLVSFDPNIRQELQSSPAAKERMMTMLSMADMIEPTLEEGRLLTGCRTDGDVLRALHAAGPKLVVLTQDKDGATFSFEGEVLRAGGIDVPVVDPTGAGDTFAAALACCLGEGMEDEAAINFCNCAGTLVCTKRGAIGMAIPTRQEVERLMASGVCHVERRRLRDMA
jgi:sugar/nucleoside kinase (ribokinase family)